MDNQTPVAVQQTTVIQVGSQKSVAGAVLLALFFGPIGMIYATVAGALIMLAISFVVAVVTLGLGLLLTAPVCAIWAGIAATNHNKRLGVSGQHAALAGGLGPAGWHPDPAGSGRLRYYDGRQWTDHYAARHPDPTPAAAAVPVEPPGSERIEASEAATAVAEIEEGEAATVVAPIDPEGAPPPERVFCGSCGAPISGAARFCSACGEAQALS